MASKKAILAIGGTLDLQGGGASLQKFSKKALWLDNYQGGEVLADAVAIPGAQKTDLAGLKEALAGSDLVMVDLGSPAGAVLEEAMAAILEAANRRTLVVLAADNTLAFYGLGIDLKKSRIQRAAEARDVVPTICYITDLPVPEDCTGAVIYQVLKDLNMKAKELGKLQEAIQRMEAALQRDNREPWDKHDCA